MKWSRLLNRAATLSAIVIFIAIPVSSRGEPVRLADLISGGSSGALNAGGMTFRNFRVDVLQGFNATSITVEALLLGEEPSLRFASFITLAGASSRSSIGYDADPGISKIFGLTQRHDAQFEGTGDAQSFAPYAIGARVGQIGTPETNFTLRRPVGENIAQSGVDLSGIGVAFVAPNVVMSGAAGEGSPVGVTTTSSITHSYDLVSPGPGRGGSPFIPEPDTFSLLLSGTIVMLIWRRLRLATNRGK